MSGNCLPANFALSPNSPGGVLRKVSVKDTPYQARWLEPSPAGDRANWWNSATHFTF